MDVAVVATAQTWIDAVPVAEPKRAAERRGDRPTPAADVQRYAVQVLDYGHDGGVARESLDGRGW